MFNYSQECDALRVVEEFCRGVKRFEEVCRCLKINNWISIAGRIDDGEPEFEDDSWFTKTAREGEDIPLRADRWIQSADVDDGSHSGCGRPACEGISCNIWKQAKIRGNMTHRLAGGARRDVGYRSFLWHEVLHNKVGAFGMYSFASILPAKIARFLFEYHCKELRTLGIPDLPEDIGADLTSMAC